MTDLQEGDFEMLNKPRKAHAVFLTIALLFTPFLLVISLHVEVWGQQPTASTNTERERGIGLYKQGDVKGAIKSLQAAVKEHKDDADAWYYLSLALSRDKDFKGARKAVENAVKLRPDFAAARATLAYFLLLSNKLLDAFREI